MKNKTVNSLAGGLVAMVTTCAYVGFVALINAVTFKFDSDLWNWVFAFTAGCVYEWVICYLKEYEKMKTNE